jgi:hypothetical protein
MEAQAYLSAGAQLVREAVRRMLESRRIDLFKGGNFLKISYSKFTGTAE